MREVGRKVGARDYDAKVREVGRKVGGTTMLRWERREESGRGREESGRDMMLRWER